MDVMVPIQNPVTTLSFLYHLDGKNISHSFKVNRGLSGLLVLLATHLAWTFNKTQAFFSLGSEARLPAAAALSLHRNFIGTARRLLLFSLTTDGKTFWSFSFVCSGAFASSLQFISVAF